MGGSGGVRTFILLINTYIIIISKLHYVVGMMLLAFFFSPYYVVDMTLLSFFLPFLGFGGLGWANNVHPTTLPFLVT